MTTLMKFKQNGTLPHCKACFYKAISSELTELLRYTLPIGHKTICTISSCLEIRAIMLCMLVATFSFAHMCTQKMFFDLTSIELGYLDSCPQHMWKWRRIKYKIYPYMSIFAWSILKHVEKHTHALTRTHPHKVVRLEIVQCLMDLLRSH